MKRIFLLASLIVSTFCAAETFSQTKVRLEIGGGYASNTLSTGVLSNWEGGWSINVAALYDLATCLQLTARTGYHQHDYAHSLGLGAPDVYGLRLAVDGDDTNVYELSFGARIVDKSKVKLFFAVRGGLLWIDVGKIRIVQKYFLNPQNALSISEYPGSGVLHRKGFASIGSGFIVPITNDVNLVLESGLLSTFDREEVIIPLTASMQIGL